MNTLLAQTHHYFMNHDIEAQGSLPQHQWAWRLWC